MGFPATAAVAVSESVGVVLVGALGAALAGARFQSIQQGG